MDAAAADKGLILADGTRLPGCSAGWTELGIWVYLTDVDVGRAFALFSDPAKTREITFIYGKMEDRLYGYTVLGALLVDSPREIRIRLKGNNGRGDFGEDSDGFPADE